MKMFCLNNNPIHQWPFRKDIFYSDLNMARRLISNCPMLWYYKVLRSAIGPVSLKKDRDSMLFDQFHPYRGHGLKIKGGLFRTEINLFP